MTVRTGWAKDAQNLVRAFVDIPRTLTLGEPAWRRRGADVDQRGEINGLRIGLLVSWREQGKWHLLRRLRDKGAIVTVVTPLGLDPGTPRWLRNLSLRLSRWYIPLLALVLCARADVWVTWNLPFGVTTGLLLRGLRWLVPLPKLVVRDFHLDLGRLNRPGYRIRLFGLRLSLPAMDQLLVTSGVERKIYQRLLSVSLSRLHFLPEGPRSELRNRSAVPVRDYVFAYGNSDRDFESLVTAAREIPSPVIILSQAFRPRGPLPENVRLMRAFVSEDEMFNLVAGSRCCVLPIKGDRVAAGQNSMLEIMALGRPLVVSRNFATEEYAEDQVSALFFDSGDVQTLGALIRRTLAQPEWTEAIARRGFERTWRLLDQGPCLLMEILARCRRQTAS